MLRLILIAVLLMTLPLAAMAEEHAGWPAGDLEKAVADLLGVEKLTLEPVGGLPGNTFLLDPTEDKSCFAGPNDRIQAFHAGQHSAVLMIGDEERIHTIWIYFPVVNVGYDEQKVAFAFYAGLLGWLFPGWTGAASWAEESLGKSWKAAGLAYQDPSISLNEMIARTSVDGARLSTWGVPPDIVTYRITARAECEKISDQLLAKPRRVFCDDAQRNPAINRARAQLWYTKPKATDVSAAPYYLGHVDGRAGKDGVMKLGDGILPDASLEFGDWIEGQRQTETETIGQMVEQGWGCSTSFMFLVNDPLFPLPMEDERNILVIDMLNADVSAGGSDLTYKATDLSALLFASTLPPLPEDIDDGPPYLMVQPGQIVFGTERIVMPVDVGATPLHLGKVQFYRGEKEQHTPGLVDIRLEGAALKVTNPATGSSAVLNLVDWMKRQTGTAPDPTRTRSISDPVIPFELDGKAHILVVEHVGFETIDGAPVPNDGVFGQLFGAR